MSTAASIERGSAAEAFSRQSGSFDAIDAANPLIGWVRDRVRAQAMRFMKSGETLLELNAGTGIDSVYFAEQGLEVVATDVAPGMIAQHQLKLQRSSVNWEALECSFLELERLGVRRFDHVFSNFGGLNCTDRLGIVLQGIDRVLLPGGTCTLVIMPRYSPWEVLSLLKVNVKLAFRRFRKVTPAQLEGLSFPCYYYSPSYVQRHLGDAYEVIEQRALSLAVPPPHMENFPKRWPGMFALLARVEDRIASFPILRNWGDHFVITLRKRA